MIKDFIEPFIEASQVVFSKTARINTELGPISKTSSRLENDHIGICLGVTGKLRGQVVFSMKERVACEIASLMMQAEGIYSLDDVSMSAITELTNIIMGKTASILSDKGCRIDITPPSFISGDKLADISNKSKQVRIPFILETGSVIEAGVAITR